MKPTEAFKYAFLKEAADRGLGPDEAAGRLREAMQKPALLGGLLGELVEAPAKVISSVAPIAGNAALAAGIGLPVGAGLIGGHVLAKAKENDSDVEQAKADELISVYDQLAEDSRRRAAAKHLRGMPI